MKTPIFDFVEEYRKSAAIRLHMPGHKGKNSAINSCDITEVCGADSLFECKGIILDSEKNASSLFGTAKTLYSAQGSTLSIQTMLALAVMRNKSLQRPLIVAVRNAHKAFLNACALLDCDVKWIFPEYTQSNICSGEFTADDIEKAISECDRTPCAVYITSPDYLGKIADIFAISKVCKANNLPFLVDNSHGAYLNFLPQNLHPIHSGADMASDSAHKTLPVLTGGGYLHIAKSADSFFAENAKAAMSVFASTSPSYLILSSLDKCNDYLASGFKADLADKVNTLTKIKEMLRSDGWSVQDGEAMKLTVFTAERGYGGDFTADFFRQNGVECEYSDGTHIVFMPSVCNSDDELYTLYNIFSKLPKIKYQAKDLSFKFEPTIQAMSIREAVFSPSEEIPVENALGRICSKSAVACPPGIPIAVSGEIISSQTINILKKSSILSVNVVK